MKDRRELEPKDLHTEIALQRITVREGIMLRPLEESDSRRILEILTVDPSIRGRVSVAARLHDKTDVVKEVASYQEDSGLMRYALLENSRVVGLVSLWRDDGFFGESPEPNAYGFGYFLDPAERGKGLVTAAVKSLMDTTAAHIQVDKFIGFCEDNNPSSIAVLERLGFVATNDIFPEPTNNWPERKYVATPTQ